MLKQLLTNLNKIKQNKFADCMSINITLLLLKKLIRTCMGDNTIVGEGINSM